MSKKTRIERAIQPDLFGAYNPDHYSYSVDFRRQIKARSMQFGVPIQIIRESTLSIDQSAGSRGLTPLSDRAWNIAVASYYKSGGKPWRLTGARPGVCYIGIAYRLTAENNRSACCAAQMFLDDGDGVVFKGETGPWYSPERGEFHLSKTAAKSLLEGVVSSYKRLGGQGLKEIFLHCHSSINKEEFEGFRDACPDSVKLVGIRVRRDSRRSVRLFREGKLPVIRGTFWRSSERSGYLWTSGYKAGLGTYDGWEIPVPIRIDIQHGEAEIEQVASDIFGLTKLNYNACRLGEAEPVTVGFSKEVGEILVSNPTVTDPDPRFKFYI